MDPLSASSTDLKNNSIDPNQWNRAGLGFYIAGIVIFSIAVVGSGIYYLKKQRIPYTEGFELAEIESRV
jgi:hypothetical protein